MVFLELDSVGFRWQVSGFNFLSISSSVLALCLVIVLIAESGTASSPVMSFLR